jgi:hypothetical protein
MLSRLVLRPVLRLLLAALISGLIPSATRPPLILALSPDTQLGPIAHSAALAQPQLAAMASAPIARPANAHSSGLPASSGRQYGLSTNRSIPSMAFSMVDSPRRALALQWNQGHFI